MGYTRPDGNLNTCSAEVVSTLNVQPRVWTWSSILHLAGVYTAKPQPTGWGSRLGSPRLREKPRGRIYALAITHLSSAAPSPRLIFISSPAPRPPPRAAPLAGCPTARAGYAPGRGEHPRARGHLAPTWPGRDGVRKRLGVPGGRASRSCATFNRSVCAGPRQPLLLSVSWQPFPRCHTNLVRAAIGVTETFCSFELHNGIKTGGDPVAARARACSCLLLFLPTRSSRGLSPRAGVCLLHTEALVTASGGFCKTSTFYDPQLSYRYASL